MIVCGGCVAPSDSGCVTREEMIPCTAMQNPNAPPPPAAARPGAAVGGPVHTGQDAQRLAARRLPRTIFDFIDGAAGQEHAAALNQSDLAHIRLAPRVLADVSTSS